jgi:hypothetical protein
MVRFHTGGALITKAPRRMTTNNMQFDYADRRYAARCLVIYSIVLEAVPSLGQQLFLSERISPFFSIGNISLLLSTFVYIIMSIDLHRTSREMDGVTI